MSQSYSSKLKEHYHHPKNFGILPRATHVAEELNPLCGDEVKIYLTVKNHKIADLKYIARGCMICIASASVLSEYIKGKSLSEIKKITKEDIDKLLGVQISPARTSCSTLALQSIQNEVRI